MKAGDLIYELRSALNHIRKNNQSVVSIDNLEKYLEQVEPLADAENNSEIKAAARQKFEDDMEVWKVESAYDIAMFESVIEAGLNALRSSIIINGGAAAALLAFVGGIINSTPVEAAIISAVGFALWIFLLGTGCAGSAVGIRYLCQFFYAGASYAEKAQEVCKGKAYSWLGNFFNFLSILLGATSYGLFFYGGWCAYVAVIN